MRWIWVVAVLAAAEAYAGTKLGDRDQIIGALQAVPPCCVIDARAAMQRAVRPLKDAVVWNDSVRIVPSGTVVVIADNDKSALAVARLIASRFGADNVLAVKGGLDTWRGVIAAQESGMPATFVIPKNTCEQGTPLETLRSNRR